MRKVSRPEFRSGLAKRQRPFEVIDVAVKVPIDLRQHGAVAMPHELRDGQVVVALDELAGAQAVTRIVGRQRLAGGAVQRGKRRVSTNVTEGGLRSVRAHPDRFSPH